LACDDQLVDGYPIANIKLGKNLVVIMKDGKGPPCDYAERHRRNDKRGYLLVASPWHREAAGEDRLLHAGSAGRKVFVKILER
jgi:hypothetical protein